MMGNIISTWPNTGLAYMSLSQIFDIHKVSLCCRDGGLKREKVKESLKEEQQKMYSNMIVGSDFHEASVGPV